MKKLNLALLVAAVMCASCGEKNAEPSQQQEEKGTAITVSSVKQTVTATAERNVFEWQGGEIVNLFSGLSGKAEKMTVSTGVKKVVFGNSTTAIYALNPFSNSNKNGPSKVLVDLSTSQHQNKPGIISADYWPMYAFSEIKNGSATLEFKPLAAAFVFNIFHSDESAQEEKLMQVTLEPVDVKGFAGETTIDLTSGQPLYPGGDSGKQEITVLLPGTWNTVKGKPDLENSDQQIFATVGRKEYGALRIGIKTSRNNYSFTTAAGVGFNLTENTFAVLNFDLDRLSVSTLVEEGGVCKEMNITPPGEAGIASPIAFDGDSDVDWDIIPDFSRVGYKYGDAEIPEVPVRETISPESVSRALSSGEFNDTTSYIQSIIDKVGKSGGGAILLKNGTYHTARCFFIDYNNTVLRGESRNGTIIKATGPLKRCVIYMGHSITQKETDPYFYAGRQFGMSSLRCGDQYNNFGDTYIIQFIPNSTTIRHAALCSIAEEYVPVGRLYFEVENPSLFNIGDEIAIYRPHNNDWISDIGMDKIAKNGREGINSGTQQWDKLNFERYWERVVTGIRGNRIYINAPVVMAIDAAYGGGKIYKSTITRISGSGVENLTIDTVYNTDENDPDAYYKGEWIDEDHAWIAVTVKAAKHCWIRNVTSKHMGYGLVDLSTACRNITVENCSCLEPVSIVNGGRRYAFNLSGGELCLIKNCISDNDRHAYITNVSKGPNVFYMCKATNFPGSIGPHQHWGTGDLYDNVSTSEKGSMEAYDRGNEGTGHGWAGANYVFWNCTAKQITCQSPWSRINTPGLETISGGYKFHSAHASGVNYVIGFKGKRNERAASAYEEPYSPAFPADGIFDYYIRLGFNTRPTAEWYPMLEAGQTGSTAISLPNPTAASSREWWPRFTLDQFTQPYSLYECQLEDRHHRGIFLNEL